jgi:hypothetical protein
MRKYPMSLTELALLDGRRPLPLGDVIGLTLKFKLHCPYFNANLLLKHALKISGDISGTHELSQEP